MLSDLFSWVINAGLRASVLSLFVLLFQQLLGRRLGARLRYALWLPVLLLLVLPSMPGCSWSLASAFESGSGVLTSEPAGMEPDMVALESAPSMVLPAPGVSLRDWLAVGWLAVAIAMLLAGRSGHWRSMKRFRRERVVCSCVISAEVERIAGRLRVVPPCILASTAVRSPAVTGLFRHTLLLPADFDEMFSTTEASLILKHELLHLKRGDLFINALLFVLQAIHWFNPVLWLMGDRVRQDREAACDAQVLELEETDLRREYGHALLKAEAACAATSLSLGLIGIAQRGAALRRRVQWIADHRRANGAAVVATLAAMMVLFVLGSSPAQQTSPETSPSKSKDAPSARVGGSSVETAFETGTSYFPGGDSIEIDTVTRHPDALVVTGRYNLVSTSEATLSLYFTLTSKGDVTPKFDRRQELKLTEKGKGIFMLRHPLPADGYPHLTLYGAHPRSAFGGVYFGTHEQAQFSKRFGLRYYDDGLAALRTGAVPLGANEKADVNVVFPNAQLSSVMAFYTKLTNRKIVWQNHLPNENFRIVSARPLSRTEAARFIEASMRLNGYNLIALDATTSGLSRAK